MMRTLESIQQQPRFFSRHANKTKESLLPPKIMQRTSSVSWLLGVTSV